jgi:hypothetical protein
MAAFAVVTALAHHCMIPTGDPELHPAADDGLIDMERLKRH